MKIDENTIIIYAIIADDGSYIAEFNTRKEANDYIDNRDNHGYNTIMWSVIPEARYNNID